MFADETRYELFDGEDPFEFETIWIGFPVAKIKRLSFHDADMFDLMLAAGAFEEDEDAEEY